MKIEIIPEENKSKSKREGDGWNLSFLFDMVFGKFGSFVDTVFDGVVSALEEAVSGTVRRVLAAAIFVIGLCFLLSGIADTLEYVYFIPGVGAMIVGAVVMLVAVTVALSVRRRR